MMEEEWLTSRDVAKMSLTLPQKTSARKLRLYLVAVCRRFWHLTDELSGRNAVECAESFAEGLVPKRRLEEVYEFVNDDNYSGSPGRYLLWPDSRQLVACIPGLLSNLPHTGIGFRGTSVAAEWKHRVEESLDMRANLFRDIFGNPFRTVTFDPAWRTTTAVGIAEKMYDTRDFGAMPILADALQDAGCEHESYLVHCRDEKQVHVRGCWVVDLVLGKE